MWQNTDSVFNSWQNTDSLFKLYFMASLMNGQHVNLSSNMLTWAPSQCVKHESMILDVSDPDPWLFRTRQMAQTHHPGCIRSRSNHDPLWSSNLGRPGWLMATNTQFSSFLGTFEPSSAPQWPFRTRQMAQTHHPGCIRSRSNNDPLSSSNLGRLGWLMNTKGLLCHFWTVFGHKIGPVNKSKKTRRVVCSNITKKSKENNRNCLGTPIESALKVRGTGWN